MKKICMPSGMPFLIIILLAFSFSIEAQSLKLRILETSDIHGAIFPYDFKNDKPMGGSLARVCSFVKKERAQNGSEVILLDNGDILQGQPAVYYFNFEKTGRRHLLAEVMNYMKYDAAAIGNHDIEAGHPVYDKFATELSFPWMAANATVKNSGKPYFTPYTIIERKGVKIAVLGLITPAIPNWLPEKIWEGMEFGDMVEAAEKWIGVIRQKEKPDLIIGLFHAGVDYNYNNQSEVTRKNENAASLVARRVKGLDIVFVGHDHHGWNTTVKDPDGKTVYILGPTSDARNVAAATVELKYNAEKKIWDRQITGEIADMKDIEPDQDFLKKFETEFDEVKRYVSRPIGKFSSAVSTRESIFGNSAFMDIIHTIQLDLTKADISFSAPLSFDTRINEGEVYVRDMFNLYKYENLLYTMELSGKEIKDYLEYSFARWFNTMKSADDHLLNFRRDEKGELVYSERDRAPQLSNQYYNFCSAAGIIYTVDVSKPEGERVSIVSMQDSSAFRLDKNYRVAVNSYRGNGGGGHLTEGAKIPKEELAGRIINSTDKDLRFYMMKWIEKAGTVEPRAFNNWKIIPDEWYRRAKEKDYQILFGKKN